MVEFLIRQRFFCFCCNV